MSDLTIVCDNCGAKYRLPASFSGDKAKCKQCSSVIDVAAQQAAGAAKPTPPAKPAAPAKAPAAARSERRAAEKAAERPARKERAAKADEAGGRRGRGAKEEGAAEGDGAGKKPRGERPEKKNHTMLLVGGGVGALAIVAVIVALSSGKSPKQTDQAAAPAAAAPAEQKSADAKMGDAGATHDAAPAAAAGDGAAAKAATPEPALAAGDAKPTAEPARTADATAEAAGAKKSAATPAATEPAADGAAKKKWEANKTTSLGDVFDPKTLGEVHWPSDVNDDKKAEVRGLMADVLAGGRANAKAKPKIESLGYPAVFGIVEQLRQLDYKSTDDQLTAWELNKLLDTILVGLNTGFEPVEAGEDLDPRKADYNARTNTAWSQVLSKWADEAAFLAWRKERFTEKNKK